MKNISILLISISALLSCPKKAPETTEITYPHILFGGVGAIGNSGNPRIGVAVAMNADGSTLLYSGDQDASGVGATFFALATSSSLISKSGKMTGGLSCAISSSGETAVTGGVDGARVYNRSGIAWAQEGSLIYGTGETGSSGQGKSVSMSADGNTIAVGGWLDNSQLGAVWVFTRTAGVWTQQGLKLVGTGVTGSTARQGRSVSLSGDGNTLVIGGPADDTLNGAVWIFTRSGGVWTQQGSKLVGSGSSGAAYQGVSTSVSYDGNTIAFGGSTDTSNQGAVWIFTRSSGIWTQQGQKITSTARIDGGSFGFSVSLTSDGNMLLVGAYGENLNQGSAYLFTRTDGAWSQQYQYSIPADARTPSAFGSAVVLNTSGTRAFIGGYNDFSGFGNAWYYYY